MKYLSQLNVPGYGQIKAPGKIPDGGLPKLSNLMGTAITMLLVFAAIGALFFFIHGGIMWITSQGDKSKLEAARSRLIYAGIGLLLIFLSFFIVSFVGALFGIKLI
jgi:hypothetical protein